MSDIIEGRERAQGHHMAVQHAAVETDILPRLERKLGRPPTSFEITVPLITWFGRFFRALMSPINRWGAGERLGRDPDSLPPEEEYRALKDQYLQHCPAPPELIGEQPPESL